MPVQHSQTAKNTRSQRNKAVLTSTARAHLDRTPSAHQLSENLYRGPPMEEEAPSRRGDTRYHERQKEKGSHQEKETPVTGSKSLRPPQDSSSKKAHHNKSKKGDNCQVSKDKSHASLLNKYNKLIGSEKERRIKKVYALIAVERTKMKNTSRGLRTGQGHQETLLEIREKPD
ncbi:hypothetical protein O181_031328 [Austropuccinia psidii MF-1]|uniref:Uncharacterized protein n=1 Tax=Austropuccinia psidii MF-1 TaxID=1389203 RepID=A0A9Q3CX86_9BASI|nr:hypothetical protein [Austropuccinia psidii MF-1]